MSININVPCYSVHVCAKAFRDYPLVLMCDWESAVLDALLGDDNIYSSGTFSQRPYVYFVWGKWKEVDCNYTT